MTPQTSNQDSNQSWNLEELLNAYKRAAEYDDYFFGDFDYSYIWKDTKPNDVY